MKSRLLAAAAATLPLALFASPAHAVLPPGNIVPNGDAEAGPGATDANGTQPVPSWDVIPNFTAVVYGTGAFPSMADSTSIGGGRNFFAGGPENGFGDISGAQQFIDISSAAPEIDRGNVQATMTADLGGYAGHEDQTTATTIFTDAGGDTFNGSVSLQPVTREERGGRTGFIRRRACTTLTPGARQAFVTVLMQRSSGPGTYNDGYIDNIDVRLSNAPCPPADDAPLPPPVETPQARVSANAEPVRGRVLVKQPGSNNFVALSDARSIPIGSEVDASKGAVQLETAANTSGASQKGEFYDGAFTLTQTRGARPITELKMAGRIDKCAGTGKDTVRAAARSRRLWGNARGRFRTRGRHASASVRGTLWSVRDTCNTTTVSVRRGSVTVRDFAKRKNVRLKAPKRYIARARKRR